MKIKILSDRAINKIAAGEVIEGPLSVIKELLENAIDAQALSIQIKLIHGGKTLILVQDNGTGISPDDMPLTIHRYATSKLQEENLDDIKYLGFRGEALCSIAAVAKLKIISRIEQSPHAWEMSLNDGFTALENTKDNHILTPASHPIGTTIEVRDLFCFTPNKLRFLRSERSEYAASIDLIERVALAFPHIGFKFAHNDKTIFAYKASLDNNNASATAILKQRIRDILGSDFINNTVYIEENTNNIKIYGYATVPTHNRHKSSRIFCFVNKRMINDPIMHHIIRAAYFNLLPNEYYPAIVLFIDIDPALIDVNVHPTKTKVRFSDIQQVKQIIIRAIRNSLGSASVSTRFTNQFIDKAQNLMQEKILGEQKRNLDNLLNGNNTNEVQELEDNSNIVQFQGLEPSILQKANKIPQILTQQQDLFIDINKEYNIAESDSLLGTAVCQIGFRYIIAETEKVIIIIDQHAAHERVILEKMKKAMLSNQIIRQPLVIPQILQFSIAEVESLISIKDDLAKLGFHIERKTHNEIIILEVPAILEQIDFKTLFISILSNFDIYQHFTTDKIDHICGNIACHASIRGKHKLSLAEINALLREIENTPFASQCNHGRPIYIKLPLSYIDQLFERL